MVFTEAVAVVVVTMDIMDVLAFTSHYVYDCFVLYNAVIDEESKELQMYAGRTVINPNILHENQFRVDFADKNGLFNSLKPISFSPHYIKLINMYIIVYYDLLATTVTSSRMALKITFKGEEGFDRLKAFLKENLKFSKIGERVLDKVIGIKQFYNLY